MRLHCYYGWLFLLCITSANASVVYEIDASPFGTRDAPLPQHLETQHEKLILVDPRHHVYGAYNAQGKLIRWGIATAGAKNCQETSSSCKTNIGTFRIYSLGDAGCRSKKYPLPHGGASMPYCMYFNGGEALHGSDDVQFNNISHGCIRVHVSDAIWLRYQFVEGPRSNNSFRGTQIKILPYE